jgi:septum formation topological specificity factor MinE
VFIKHGEINDQFTLKLDFIRDLNNKLGLLTQEQHSERFESISTDTLDQICKFHNISREEIKNDFEMDKRYKVQDINYNFQIMIVV